MDGVIGVDEVGRGALAGDLVIVAAMVPKEFSNREILMDSKQFSSRAKRRAVFEVISRFPFEMVRKTPAQIEQVGIHRAVLEAMDEAVLALAQRVRSTSVIFDGRFAPRDHLSLAGRHVPCEAMTKADAKVPAVSAASIIAKVTRDEEMDRLAVDFPGYGFERNAGYGTQEHRDGLAMHGMSEIHRSWARKFTQ